ncbi:MAG TPA: DUF1569 domain-containing protein [Flavisolibacter sp.]|nr:DUF1569 domain-containing protein [Flavisolibacter sp.]
MKKNLLYPEVAQQIIERVQRLQATSKAQWGKMNATEMLLHCNLCNEQIFKGEAFVKRTTARQYLLRLLALYVAPHFKKGIRGDAKNETKGRIGVWEFESQKQRFTENIGRFLLQKEPLRLPHIAFGNLSTGQWGIAAYKHMDHHLRQFGV